LCANLEELDKEGDTVGVSLQMLKTAADFLLGPSGEFPRGGTDRGTRSPEFPARS
jgi:hypothetical protein